jgi:phage virion morphogenesis protein
VSDDHEALERGRGEESRAARRRRRQWDKNAAAGTAANDFAPLEQLLGDLASAASPAEVKKLGRAVATVIRDANAKRLRANVTPDGAPMVPRKLSERGTIRSKKIRDKTTRLKRSAKIERMFQRAVAPQYLRKWSSTGEAQVGFVGAMARIMRVHHYGRRDHVVHDDASSPELTYPARPVIGLTDTDRARVLDKLADNLLP